MPPCREVRRRREQDVDQSWLYIYDTQGVIRQFQRQANASLPIATLPPEILVHIFRFCIIEPQDVYQLGLRRVCLAFSQVCDRWRRVALADRRLWANPVLYDPTQSPIILARANGFPLHVTMCLEDDLHVDEWSSEFQSVLAHPDLHQLSIMACAPCRGISKLVKMIKDPLPQLRSLEILTAVPTPLRSAGLENPAASTLERLYLTSCILPWDAHCLDNLVRLDIRCPQTSLVPRADIRHILKALGNMSSLKFLQLSRAISLGTDTRPTTKVFLGSLQDLCLYDDGDCVSEFLCSITTPSMARIEAYTLDGPLRHIASIVNRFHEWVLSRADYGHLTRFDLQLFEPLPNTHSVKLRLGMQESSAYKFNPYVYAYFDIDLANFADLVRHTVSTLHSQLRTVLVLNVSFPRHFEPPALVGALWQVMSALPRVEHVTAGGYAFLSLLELFEGDAVAHVFPSLQTLKIEGAVIAHWDAALSESKTPSPAHRIARLSHRLGGRSLRPGICLVNCESNVDLATAFAGCPGVRTWWQDEKQYSTRLTTCHRVY